MAARLASGIEALGVFRLLSDDRSLPLVAFSFLPLPDGAPRPYDEFQLADKLRERGWVLPAYTMAPKAPHVKLLRAVVREDLSMSMCEQLVRDIERAVAYLDHFHGGLAQRAVAAAPPAPAAAGAHGLPGAADAWTEKHHPHRVHKHGHKRHAGVC